MSGAALQEDEKLFVPSTEEGVVKTVSEWTEAEVWEWLKTLRYAHKLQEASFEYICGNLLAGINEEKLEAIGVHGPVVPLLLLDINEKVIAIERQKILAQVAADEKSQEERLQKRLVELRQKKELTEVDLVCGCIPRIRQKHLEPRVFSLAEGEEDERHEVRVQIFVNSLNTIDSSTETWIADFWVRTIWKDEYLLEVRKSGEEFRVDWDDPSWFQPKIEVVNSHNVNLVLEQKFVIGDEIFCEQRWRGSLHSDMNLQMFPFDQQKLRIDLESSFHAVKFIKFVTALEDAPLFSEKCRNNPEFNILHGKLSSSINKVEFITEDDADFERYSLTLLVERKSGFYVARIGFLNILCVLIGMSIDFLDPSDPGKRLNITTTMFLTLVAFQFAVADSMPKISYFTLLDYMVLICYFVMAATIIQAIVQYNRYEAGESAEVLFEADLSGFFALVALLFGSVLVLSGYGLQSFIRGAWEQVQGGHRNERARFL